MAFVDVAALSSDHVRLDPAKTWPMIAIVASAFCAAVVGVAAKRHGKAVHAAAGGVLTFLVHFTLPKTWSVARPSFISVFTPVIALIRGFVFLDERPTAMTAVGAALILGGVTLALSEQRAGRA